MQPVTPRRRRARPVADAPVNALLERTGDVAKGWLVALLEDAPLEAAPTILASDVVRDGPRVCEAVLRALTTDADLRRLGTGGGLESLVVRIGAWAGGDSAAATSRAVRALGEVVWTSLRTETPAAEAELAVELFERLSLVVETVRSVALSRTSAEPAAPYPPVSGALWRSALEDEISRAQREAKPVSLLLVELEDAERVRAIAPPVEASSAFGRVAEAVRGAVRRQDILACETESRAWIIARDTGRLGAQALAARVIGAVSGTEPWRGAPMDVSVGFATLGVNGRDARALIEAAEEAQFAASASGSGVVAGPSADAGGSNQPAADEPEPEH